MPDFTAQFLAEFAALRARVSELEERERSTNFLVLKDGITAPDAVAGLAIIYIDSGTGDLRIEFGDDFGATIVADS